VDPGPKRKLGEKIGSRQRMITVKITFLKAHPFFPGPKITQGDHGLASTHCLERPGMLAAGAQWTGCRGSVIGISTNVTSVSSRGEESCHVNRSSGSASGGFLEFLSCRHFNKLYQGYQRMALPASELLHTRRTRAST